jgi:tryptophan halogenase
MGIRRFVSLYPSAVLPDVIRDEYNRLMTEACAPVRHFININNKATERDDTPLWDNFRTMDIPDSLRRKIELFREAGRVFRYEDELFTRPSWVAVFLGQHIVPQQCDPIVAVLPPEDVLHSVESMRVAMANAAAHMPTHQDFIRSYCPASA